MYLTLKEFSDLGFDEVDNFEQLLQRAELLINRYICDFYSGYDFEMDYSYRKKAIKLATAFQVDYLHKSGILTAEDKQAVSSIRIGRTSVDMVYSSTHNQLFNLSVDTLFYLKQAGFGYAGVSYDR